MRRLRPSLSGKRGTVLLVCALLSTGLALSLGSFMILSVTSSNLSNRSFYFNSAQNLSEAGVERALHALKTADWSGWTGATDLTLTLPAFDLGQGATTLTTVRVYGATTSTTPRIVAEGRTVPRFGGDIVKQLEVTTKRRSLFAAGIVASEVLTFGSDITVDSWQSDPDHDPGTPPIAYDTSVARDRGSVSASEVRDSGGDVVISGFVATQPGMPPELGAGGKVISAALPTGDPSRVTEDFAANLDPAPLVSHSTLNDLDFTSTPWVITRYDLPALSLPQATDVYEMINGERVYFYRLIAVYASGSSANVLNITDNVVLLPTSSGNAIVVEDDASIYIHPGASLTIYTRGDVRIEGRGITTGGTSVATANAPARFQLYGTRTGGSAQDFVLNGRGVLSGVCYAPHANLSLDASGGSPEILGSFIAKNVFIGADAQVHYDESLADFIGRTPYAVTSWRELYPGSFVTF